MRRNADAGGLVTRPLDPALAALRAELERAGNVVVPHGDHICVRLPMLASVRVYVDGDRLRLDPQLGPFRRAHALALTLITATVAGVGGFLIMGVDPAAFAVAFAGVGAMFADLSRVVLTESCMTRVQLAWSTSVAPRLTAGEGPKAVEAPISVISPALPKELSLSESA